MSRKKTDSNQKKPHKSELLVYDNRELSWLKFNKRVLEEAQDAAVPLYERLKFVSIFHNNLDEFFMVRVGTLQDELLLKHSKRDAIMNMTAKQQLSSIFTETARLMRAKDAVYAEIMHGLSKVGITHENIKTLSHNDLHYLEQYFFSELMPLLSPQIINEQNPFPFLQNKEVYIGVTARFKQKKTEYGIIPAGKLGRRIIYLPADNGKLRFVLVEEVLLHFAHLVFPNFTLTGRVIFRITRNADINVEEALYDHDVDLRDAMQKLLKKRTKLAATRCEISTFHDDGFALWIADRLNISKKQIFKESSPLDMSFGFLLEKKLADFPTLYFAPLEPQPSPDIKPNVPMIRQILKKDILLSYPYEDIKQFIRLLNEASVDPYVVSIKITLYRVANDSKVIDALARAVEHGKDVLTLVELRARFDEENNIGWSKRLEEAGCKVIYGLEGLKVHSKLLLITRKIGNKFEYITQIGTGNYNEKTSKIYTDLSLMTSNREFAADATAVFNALCCSEAVDYTKHLLVAPKGLKRRVLEMIDEQIANAVSGKEAYVGLKLNSLSDKVMIDKLIEASQSGVKIEMVVRGICCLVPGLEGKTENIKIISIVGRFLEHSRIYIFGKNDDTKIYISSADFMTRNTDRRIEVAAPVYDKKIKAKIIELFKTLLADNVKARTALPDKTYAKIPIDAQSLDAQVYLYRQAYSKAGEKPNTKKANAFIRLLRKLFAR